MKQRMQGTWNMTTGDLTLRIDDTEVRITRENVERLTRILRDLRDEGPAKGKKSR